MFKTSYTIDPGAKVLDRAFSDLRDSRTVRRSERDVGAQLGPEARITRYLERLQYALSLAPENNNRLAPSDRLVRWLKAKAVLDTSDPKLVEKVARGIFDSERRALLERGHGALLPQASFENHRVAYENLVTDKRTLQISSLNRWVDYLRINDALHPAWFRYLAIRGVIKMGAYNRDTPAFNTRSKDTIAPFPELNSEALGLVFKGFSKGTDIGALVQNFDPSNIEPFRKALGVGSFSALYAVALRECNKTIDRSRLEGEWRKYDKGSDYTILEKDLEGKGTGWCTATGSAKAHVAGGDFYVFYTKDKDAQFSVPRVAIRLENDEIAEIRGIAPAQEMEPDLIEIAEEKGQTLPGYERFKKASADMKQLTAIDKRCFTRDAGGAVIETLQPNPPLSSAELRFIYQTDSKISSFGYQKDPRIEQIMNTRSDPQGDYANIYNVRRAQVTSNKDEISSDTRVYIGALGPSDYWILNDRKETLVIIGKADFNSCSSLERIPEGVVFNGPTDFALCSSLASIAKGVVFNGDVRFELCRALTSIADGVVFNGKANFSKCSSLTSIPKGVVFSDRAVFADCTSLLKVDEGVVFRDDAQFARCHLLNSIAKGVVFKGDAGFSDCYSLESIPQGVMFLGDADFDRSSLGSIPQGVVFNGDARFKKCLSLKDISKGVVFNGNADFAGSSSLRSISEGVVFKGGAHFAGCINLRTIGRGTKFYGPTNFNECTNLESDPEDFTESLPSENRQ